MARTAGMNYQARLLELLHQYARATGMIQMHMRRNNILDLRLDNTQRCHGCQYVWHRVIGSGFDDGDLIRCLQQVNGGDVRFDVKRIDAVNTL